MSVFPSFSAYEFGVGKKKFPFYLKSIFVWSKENIFQKERKKDFPFHKFQRVKEDMLYLEERALRNWRKGSGATV